MAQEVKLSASTRTNLLSLQATTRLIGRTQERLSTGLKVNSALDDASAFFQARSLTNRAAEGEGWFFKLKAADADTADLMDRAAYDAYLETLA